MIKHLFTELFELLAEGESGHGFIQRFGASLFGSFLLHLTVILLVVGKRYSVLSTELYIMDTSIKSQNQDSLVFTFEKIRIILNNFFSFGSHSFNNLPPKGKNRPFSIVS